MEVAGSGISKGCCKEVQLIEGTGGLRSLEKPQGVDLDHLEVDEMDVDGVCKAHRVDDEPVLYCAHGRVLALPRVKLHSPVDGQGGVDNDQWPKTGDSDLFLRDVAEIGIGDPSRKIDLIDSASVGISVSVACVLEESDILDVELTVGSCNRLSGVDIQPFDLIRRD